MGTKNNPGDYDCYANAEPDEPMFVLLARDEKAPVVIETWADLAAASGTSEPKVHEALHCAYLMREWRSAHRADEKKGPPPCAGLSLRRAILAITVDAPDGQPNGEAERQIEQLVVLLNPGTWPADQSTTMARLQLANGAAARLCTALADDTQRLRVAAEAFFGSDFSKPPTDEIVAEVERDPMEDAPHVCPGCFAVGEERCAPGCIDAEIEEEAKHREVSTDDEAAPGSQEIPW